MGRRLRVMYANRHTHVMFHTLDDHWFTREDFRRFKNKLSNLVEKNKMKISYFSFMENHIHIIFDFSEDQDSSMQVGVIEWCFTNRYNSARNRKGSLWRGRFKDVTIETQTHFWNAVVYVALNKIKTGSIRKLSEDYYSSYRAYAYGIDDGITTLCEDFYEMGRTPEERQAEFRSMIRRSLLAWRNEQAWEKLEKGEEVLLCDGKVDLSKILAMDLRQEEILAKGHLNAQSQHAQRVSPTKDVKPKVLEKIAKKKEKLAESLALRGIPPWVLTMFWAAEGYIVDFVWSHPDRFGLARAPN